jgi:hypothetical protein
MYFLVLAALLQLDTVAPKVLLPFDTFEDCAKAAQDANKDPRLQTPDSLVMGLRFVCLKLVPDA